MSGLQWGIGDLLAMTKLAWDLYHNCYLVAKDAPDDFRQLVNELASLQGVLRTLRDDINSDASFLERMGENRKEMLERCLANCFETLHKLQKVVHKYRELGVGDGLQFWRKLKWVGEKGAIADLKSNIMVHTCNISLCMSSIGNSSLARIETSMLKALERQEAAEKTLEDEEKPAPLEQTKTVAMAAPHEPSDMVGPGINRVFTGATLVEATDAPSESTPSMSSDDVSESPSGSPATPIHKRHWVPTSTSEARKGSNITVEQRPKAIAISTMVSDDETFKIPRRLRRLPSIDGPLSTAEPDKASDVDEAVADAKKTLSIVRQKEQSTRPLRITRPDPQHQADEKIQQKFQQSVDEELEIKSFNAKDWLRVAAWWLLKARYTMRLEKPELSVAHASKIFAEPKTPASPAYIDLLKAQWVLHAYVLLEENRASLMAEENRKLFHSLSDGIREEFDKFRPTDESDRDALLGYDNNVFEFCQAEEETCDDYNLSPGFENDRWIAVEQSDAGGEDETVIFRTFVNAAIGAKKSRMRSKGARYMLLLSTKDGESEPRVTICNQSGTLALTRDITSNDLQETSFVDSPLSDSVRTFKPIPLNFGRMNVTISFTNEADLETIMRIPRAYFKAVRRRELRQLSEKASETLLFKSSVEVFEQLKASNMTSMSPKREFQSSDLRILETTTKEAWRTTRRLVLSSSAAEKKPWCKDMFLPTSRIHLNRSDHPRQVIIKWSDCTHERSQRTDGAYNKIYDYVYDDSDPNICLRLVFRTQVDATAFESTILTLSLSPILSWTIAGTTDFRHLYNVSDTEPNARQYKALLITSSRSKWRYAELFYIYRDIDFAYDHAALRVRFPSVYYTHYISTHVDKLYAALPDRPPKFSHCEKEVSTVSLDFEDEPTAQRLMSALTSNYKLLFSRPVRFISTKAPSRFKPTKPKQPAEVQLWQKANSIRLLSRWGDSVEDKWLSMAVPRGVLAPGRDSNQVVLPNIAFERGRKMDMSRMVARDARERRKDGGGVGSVAVAFESVRDREEFAAAIEGQVATTSAPKSAFEELMKMGS